MLRLVNTCPALAVLCGILLRPDPAHPFGDGSVRVFPTCDITPSDRVVLEVAVFTPNTPPFLAQPTQVVVEGENILVTVFPDWGIFTAIDSLLVTVDLGKFAPGVYQYEVALHYPYSGGEPPTASGEFIVVEEPCAAALASPKRIYWADYETGTVKRATLDGTKVENLAVPGLGAVSGFVPDFVNHKLYWSDWYWGDWSGEALHRIQRSDLDGQNVEPLVTTTRYPSLAAIDLGARKLYWTEDYKIRRCNLDGSDPEDIVTSIARVRNLVLAPALQSLFWIGGSQGGPAIQGLLLHGGGVHDLVSGLGSPSGLFVDVQGDRMYWGDRGTIWRANLDGSSQIPLVPVGFLSVVQIALDSESQQLFWVNGDNGHIQRAELDGTGVEDFPVDGLCCAYSVVVEPIDDNLYWSHWGGWPWGGGLKRANLDGSDVEDVATGLGYPVGTTIDACGHTAGFTSASHRLLVDCLSGPNLFTPASCRCADLSADQRVDLIDFSILQRVYANP